MINWIKHKSGNYYLHTNIKLNKIIYKNLVIIDIDCGLAWNPRGKKYSLPKKDIGWVWAHSEIPNYIDSFFFDNKNEENYLPVLYSENNSKDVIIEMCEDLNFRPLIILGMTINDAISLAIRLFENQLKNYKVITIPTLCDEIEGWDLDELDIAAEQNYPDPCPFGIGILIGQQGSGKTRYSKFLAKQGYIIIDEKEAEKIRNKRTKKVIKQFEEYIKLVLKSKKSLKDFSSIFIENRGIIIDATHATEESRSKYTQIIEELNLDISIINLWISKSGWHYNSKRQESISKIALNIYSGKFELPLNYKKVL